MKDYPQYHYLLGAVLKKGAPPEAIEEARKMDAIDMKYDGEHSFLMFVPKEDRARWIAMRKKQKAEEKAQYEANVQEFGIF